MSKASKYIIAIVAAIAIAIGAGYLGAGMRSGVGGEAGSGNNDTWLQKIRDAGELRIGVASGPPMTGEQEDGTMGGPNILPLEQLAEEMGVEVVTVPADWANIVAGLQADRYDVAASLDATSERAQAIQFTDPVFTYPAVFIVEADSGLASTTDVLEAGRVAAANGTAYGPTIESLGATVVYGDGLPNSISMVPAGRADAAFADLFTAIGAAQADPNLKIVVPEPAIHIADSNYGVNEDVDARSMNVLNIAIRQSQNNGTLSAVFAEAGIVDENELGDLEMTE